MGDILSTPSQLNFSSSVSTDTIASPDPSQTLKPKSPDSEDPIHPPQDHTTAEIDENPSKKVESLLEEKVSEDSIKEGVADGEEEEEEEEERECGFCLYMKAGGCRESFIEWEKCFEEEEKNKDNFVEKCSQARAILTKCMEANSDYYGPLLQAEKDAEEEEVAKQLEEEKLSDGDGKEEALGNPEEKQVI